MNEFVYLFVVCNGFWVWMWFCVIIGFDWGWRVWWLFGVVCGWVGDLNYDVECEVCCVDDGWRVFD